MNVDNVNWTESHVRSFASLEAFTAHYMADEAMYKGYTAERKEKALKLAYEIHVPAVAPIVVDEVVEVVETATEIQVPKKSRRKKEEELE